MIFSQFLYSRQNKIVGQDLLDNHCKILCSGILGLLFFARVSTIFCVEKESVHKKHDRIMQERGYNNYNMRTNGEQKVVESIIHDGWIVFDVGAGTGDWSKIVHKKCPTATIYAFEPVPSAYSAFCKKLPFDNIRCFNMALSDTAQITTMNYYHKRTNLSTLFERPAATKAARCSAKKITVSSCTLDDFCKKNQIYSIDFLKIDAEGAETLILKGAQRLLEEHRIRVIQFEYGGTFRDANTTLKYLYDSLSDHGFNIYRIAPTGLIAVTSWKNELENYHYSNYLAVHRSESIISLVSFDALK